MARSLTTLVLAFFFLLPLVSGQDMEQISAPVTDTLSNLVEEKSNFLQSLPFDVHGSVDAYYQHSSSGAPPTSARNNRKS